MGVKQLMKLGTEVQTRGRKQYEGRTTPTSWWKPIGSSKWIFKKERSRNFNLACISLYALKKPICLLRWGKKVTFLFVSMALWKGSERKFCPYFPCSYYSLISKQAPSWFCWRSKASKHIAPLLSFSGLLTGIYAWESCRARPFHVHWWTWKSLCACDFQTQSVFFPSLFLFFFFSPPSTSLLHFYL